MQEIMDNNIRIYSGEIDEEEDSPEIKELRVMGVVCCVRCVEVSTFSLTHVSGIHPFCGGSKYNSLGSQWEESPGEAISLGGSGK